MRPSDKIDNMFSQAELKTNSNVDTVVLDDAINALAQSKQSKPDSRPQIWSKIMKSRITKSAVAAIIIIAVLTGIYQITGSIDGATPAFADVLENISKTGSVVYKEISEIPGYTFNSVQMVNKEGIIRSELGHDTVMIMDPVNQVTLWLHPSKKEAERYGEPSPIMKPRSFSYIGWVRKLHEGEAEFAGQEEFDGQMANVYVWDVPFEKITVWVDPKVNLPVKVEHKRFANTEKEVVMPQMSLSMSDFGGDTNISAGGSISSGRGSGKGITQNTTRTMYDFQWDVELDESLFSLEPPEGYSLEQKYPEKSSVDNNSLVHILDFWAKMNDGQFPTEEQLNDPEAFKPFIIDAYDKDGDSKKEFDQARNEVSRVLKGIYFVQEKKVDGRWGYVGQEVVLGQKEMIVCWWFDEETKCYKAILGNLSIVEVLEDQLPIQP